MKKSLTLVYLALLAQTHLLAQIDTCNCLDNLNKLIQKIEENYAGYPAKVNSTTKERYEFLVNDLRQKSRNEQNPKNCF